MVDSQQRTLFNLRKVVRLEASTVCFSEQDIASLRSLLLDASSSKHALLCALRKLDCYRLELHDLQRSGIGAAVATLTAHPKPEVARFASALLDKLRAVAEASLFPRLPYDAAAAAAAPDGEAQTPEEAIAIAARLAKAERRRRQIEAQRRSDCLEVLSSSEEEDEGAPRGPGGGGDEDWVPGSQSRRQRTDGEAAAPGNPWTNPLAAKYAADSAFRKTRAGSRVPLDAEQSSDGRMYRQATLLFRSGAKAGPVASDGAVQPLAGGPAMPSQEAVDTTPAFDACRATVVVEDLIVGSEGSDHRAMVIE